jgi:hypothetical protein
MGTAMKHFPFRVSGCVVLLFSCALAAPPVPQIISPAEWGSKPLPLPEDARHTPRVLTIHHAGVLWKPTDEPFARTRNLQAWGQKEKNWPDLPYHYLISPDGRIFAGRDVNYRPESNTQYDLTGVVNIHLWGNFEEQRVSPEQLASLVALCAHLCETLKLNPAEIRGHADAAPGQTSCPGKDLQRYISQGLLQKWTAESMAGKSPDVASLPPLEGGPTTQIATTRPAN